MGAIFVQGGGGGIWIKSSKISEVLWYTFVSPMLLIYPATLSCPGRVVINERMHKKTIDYVCIQMAVDLYPLLFHARANEWSEMVYQP